MKLLPTGLQAHLDDGATTMCTCWRLTRRDGVVMGFTDHDEDLTFDGTAFEAEAGFNASAVQQSLGLAIDNLEVVSAFDSNSITENDLIAGVYDDAGVEVFTVNWQDVAQHVVIMVGNVGEVVQTGIQFTAELRSLTHRLNQKVGRVYQRTCDAKFADDRCRLNAASYTETGVVTEVFSKSSFKATGLGAVEGRYSRGVLTWTGGGNINGVTDVRTHTKNDAVSGFDVWTPAVQEVQVGDTFSVLAGCLQTPAACKAYSNYLNFQGFPHMPGKDIVTVYAKVGETNQNGGAIVL